MTLTFVCQSCDDSFEVDFNRLTDDTRRVKCPGCGKKVPPAEMDELASTLDDLLTQIAAIRKRFAISMEIDADDLPAPYESGAKRSAQGDDDDEDVEDDDLGEDDLDEDEDEDDRF